MTAGRANGRPGPTFEPGLQLAVDFYRQVVQPLLVGRPHSAARLGEGSDVLGFDTERSTDHGWGPRLQVFVGEADEEEVRAMVEAGLPERFRGWPVWFGWDDVPVTHHVEVDTPERWLTGHLGFDPTTSIGLLDWLATPQQLLLQVTAGRVFHDGLEVLARVRSALAWYPDELWRWLLGSQWTRIAQEEAFVVSITKVRYSFIAGSPFANNRERSVDDCPGVCTRANSSGSCTVVRRPDFFTASARSFLAVTVTRPVVDAIVVPPLNSPTVPAGPPVVSGSCSHAIKTS